MKRELWIVVLLIFMGVAPFYVQSESLTESMTEEELDEFNRNRLTVDVGTTSTLTGGFGWSFGWSMESYERWTGRNGFDRLSESQFYAIAGYPVESQKAATYKKVGWGLAVGGGVMSFGGLLWMMLGSFNDNYDDPNWDTKTAWSLYGGMALSLGGIIPLWIGSSRVRKNWSSAEQAQTVAERYNRRLAKKIRGE